MKKFLARISKTPAAQKSGQSPGSQPRDSVPPVVTHPCPHEHIAILVTADGLLLRPHGQGVEHTGSYAMVRWAGEGTDGKVVRVQEVAEGEVPEGETLDWDHSVVVYGIVGILELFSYDPSLSYQHHTSWSSLRERTWVNAVLGPTHDVYAVKGVTTIPLSEGRARAALNALTSRNDVLMRPSLLPSRATDALNSTDDDGLETRKEDQPATQETTARVVQFALEDDVRIFTPTSPSFGSSPNLQNAPRPPSPCGSDMSTLSSERSGTSTPVAKTIASKLSFWTRLSKRTSVSTDAVLSPGLDSAPISTSEEQEAIENDIKEQQKEPTIVLDSILANTAPPPASVEERYAQLESKIVRECVRQFTKGGMYFAYNFDITRSLQHKQQHVAKTNKQQALLADLNALEGDGGVMPLDARVDVFAEPYSTLPLWRRVDRHFWWNEWLSKPFVDAGLHSYVLPIMQGYCQISSFPIAREPVAFEEGEYALVDYIVISRRSRDRAGLRYQRRGVDDEAHVANFVETETIMRVKREGYTNVFAYVQIRGSIPLFWMQSSYGLKPPPQLSKDRTHAQHLDTLRRHLDWSISRYGPHCIVNLAELGGKEGVLSRAYREHVNEISCQDAQYHEYDFHTETRGMKYENIFNLIEKLERTFEQQGYLWISDGFIMSQQKGVFRVNCIDCLDRTNVVQSAFARHVLETQLDAVALHNPSEDEKTEADVVFNDMWANNGDAISRAYAGTSALKGDYTRTGRRDLTGLLNDGVNSLARMYSSTFSDWFSQAVIDFMLGSRTLSVFSEFLFKLQSTDPRELIRLSRIRAEAVATSAARVLSERERLLAGWTLFAPEQLNVKLADKFEEKVLLLTVRALYIISYDYTLQKVKMYTRVPLGDVVGISKGAYILSPLEAASRDPTQNAGFVVTWNNFNQTTRVSSYSVRNSFDIPSSPTSPRNFKNLRGSASPPSSPLRNTTYPNNRTSRTPPTSPTSKSVFANSNSPIPSPRSPQAGSPRPRSATPSRKRATLSQILSSPLLAEAGEANFAAFKALPINPARIRRASGDGAYTESDNETGGAKNCKDAVDAIVEAIRQACKDIRGADDGFVTEQDVVCLAEAQRMTSMYAKMEYGVKRLLWLGG